MEFIIIFIACMVAGLICLGLYNSMKPVSKKSTAGQYVSKERLVMSINEDNFLRETESRTRIVDQAAPGMAAGSAGAKPGQTITFSASAPGPTVSQQHFGGNMGGNAGGNTGGSGTVIHLGGTQSGRPGQQIHTRPPGVVSPGSKPDNIIDLSKKQ